MSSTDGGPRGRGAGSEWQGYEWQIPLDEIVDCDKCSPGCRNCYYKCRGLPVACKAGIIFALLAITVLLTAFIIRFGSFGPGEYLIGNGDQIQFSDGSSQNDDNGYSRLFCSDYTLTSTSLPPKTFSSYAVMSKSKKQQVRLNYIINEVILLTDDFYVLVHNFYQSDTLIIKGCILEYEIDAHLYIIRGEENFKKWGNDCSSCYTKEIFKPCRHEERNEVHLTFSSTDIVYFYYKLEYWYPWQVSLVLEFTFDRQRYEKEDIVDLCHETTSCKLSIPLHTKDIIIEQALLANESLNTIRTECGARFTIYFAFFVCVPAGIMIVIGCLGLILKRCQDDLIRDMERADRVREYDRFRNRRPPRATSTSQRSSQTTVNSGVPRFSSTSLSSNRALSISATVPLIENEQSVGSLPPNYNSLVVNEHNNQRQANEPPPPEYRDVTDEIVTVGDQSGNEQPPPSYDDVTRS